MMSDDKMSMSLDEIIKKQGRGSVQRGTRGRSRNMVRGRGRSVIGRGRGDRVRGFSARPNDAQRGRAPTRGRGAGAGAGRGRALRGRYRSASRGRSGLGDTQRWIRSRSRSRTRDAVGAPNLRARSRSRGRGRGGGGGGDTQRWFQSRSRSRTRVAVGGPNQRARSRSRGPVGGGGGGRSRSRSRVRSLSRARSLPRAASRGRSRSRSRPPQGAGRARSRSRSTVRLSRSLTPGGRGRARAPPRLVLFRAAPGASPRLGSRGGLRRSSRGARNLLSRGRLPGVSRPVGGLNEWKMAGTFRSDYIQRNYQPSNNFAGTNDIYYTSNDGGGNQLLVNIQNEYAMHPSPGARRTWQRGRGLHRNQVLCVFGGNRASKVDVGAGGDTFNSTPSTANVSKQTVALRGSSRNSTNYGLPRKMMESPAQLVPTLVVEQNVVGNMGQPSANTTRMTLSERFSKQHSSGNETETVFVQGDK